jgi:hypothetical protein
MLEFYISNHRHLYKRKDILNIIPVIKIYITLLEKSVKTISTYAVFKAQQKVKSNEKHRVL